ncbi:unnamed protein product, partial [marine sediment metagenome]
KPGSSNEEVFIDLLAILKMKTERLPAKMKDKILRALKDKNRNDNLTMQ